MGIDELPDLRAEIPVQPDESSGLIIGQNPSGKVGDSDADLAGVNLDGALLQDKDDASERIAFKAAVSGPAVTDTRKRNIWNQLLVVMSALQ